MNKSKCNISYITFNCFQSDYCIFVYIYSYSASQQHRHLLVRWRAFKKRTHSIKLLKNLSSSQLY